MLDPGTLREAMQGQHVVYANLAGKMARQARAIVDVMHAGLPEPGSLGRDLNRALDHPNQVGVQALQPITRGLAASGRYSIRKVTTLSD